MPDELDPNEVVIARFIPADQTYDFSFNSDIDQGPEFSGRIRWGDVVKMRRAEATSRSDFQIVGEEDATTSPDAPQAPPARVEVGGSVVAPPPPPPTDSPTTADDKETE